MLQALDHLGRQAKLAVALGVLGLFEQPGVDHLLDELGLVAVLLHHLLHRFHRLVAVGEDELHDLGLGEQLVGAEEGLAVELAVLELHVRW